MPGYCQIAASATGAKMAEVEAPTTTYFLFVMVATNQPSTGLLADRTNYTR